MIDGLLNMFLNMTFLSGYVSWSNSFPQPLNEEEEKECINKLKNGDSEAKGVLIQRNLRLVAHIVKKYNSTGKDTDELISIGTVGLIKAIDSFEPTKGTKLATYAARCIENEILMLIRNSKKTKGEVFLQDPIGVDKEGNEISLLDILSSSDDSIIDIVESRMQVNKLYEQIDKCLKGREKKIIIMRYGLGNGNIKTQREIAGILGISRSYVSRIEKRALNKLLKVLQVTNKF